MAEDNPPGSPIWWIRRLHTRMLERRPIIESTAAYYDGAHNLAYAGKKFRETFGTTFKPFADNWTGVVVDACEERLNIVGFRVDDEVKADDDANAIWQENDMDAQAQMGHTDSLVGGASCVTTWIRDEEGTPEITVDSAMNTIVETHPKHRRRRLAALRCWTDPYGYEHAELFLPDEVYLFKSKNKVDSTTGGVDPANCQWEVDEKAEGVDLNGAMTNPLGVVPVVELLNRPRLHIAKNVGWIAHSEINAVIPLQDAANKLMADMLTASEAAAFPQRWLVGYEPGEDPKTKAPLEPNFKAGAGMLWWLEDPSAKFGQFQAADLSNYVQAIGMVVMHIASISATPPHYLNASADRLSGESIKSAESGLIAKTRRKMVYFGDTWETVMRLAGAISGNQALTQASSMETIWANPETRTEAELADAAVKQLANGVPWQARMEFLGYTPAEIDRMRTMRAEDALDSLLNPPAPPPAPAPPSPAPTPA